MLLLSVVELVVVEITEDNQEEEVGVVDDSHVISAVIQDDVSLEPEGVEESGTLIVKVD